ncbi:MAG TPA: HipA domain-containing protein [Solirubrobacterales bacterium]|nr:HipA domain-containing protein [Solirubrobacterales bacterium]
MSLDVYLYGERIGTLFPAGENDYRLAYTPERIAEFRPGTAVLSNSLPSSDQPYSADASRAFVEGLLPEGMRRTKLAGELGIDPGDGYALIAEIGRDCAGGVSFLPEDEPGPGSAPHEPAWLGDDELEELVTPPPSRLLDPDRKQRMRFALAGVRHKLSLVRAHAGGAWAWPDVSLPSTHIVKPETGEYPELVPNEMFCTTVAREAGLPAVPTSIETMAGQPCVVSERFDRSGEGLETKRFHQETFCQALSFAPDAEEGSAEADGPGFAESCGLLRAIGESDSVTTLLAAAFTNYILGNGDAHGNNFALMIVHDGALLAPFYDIASTAVYGDPVHRGMVIAEDYAEMAYLLELASICEEAEIDFEHCRRIAANVSARIGAALETVAERAREEGWYAPVIDGIVELASDRALGLGYEVQY